MFRRFFLIGAVGAMAASSRGAEDLYFDSHGVKIHYAVEGKGQPVVLVHGFSSSIDKEWRRTGVWSSLTQNHMVVGLDLRGHGKSEKLLDPDKYGVELAGDVLRLMNHVKLAKAHIVGYSMGGLITEYLLVHHSDRMITATIGGMGRLRAGDPGMAMTSALADFLDNGKQMAPLFDRLRPPDKPPGDHPLDAVRHLLNNNQPKALAACARALPKLSVSDEQLRAAKTPALAIVGDKDMLKVTVDEMKKVMPNLKVKLVKGTDHGSTLRAAKFVDDIKAFIERHSTTTVNPPT